MSDTEEKKVELTVYMNNGEAIPTKGILELKGGFISVKQENGIEREAFCEADVDFIIRDAAETDVAPEGLAMLFYGILTNSGRSVAFDGWPLKENRFLTEKKDVVIFMKPPAYIKTSLERPVAPETKAPVQAEEPTAEAPPETPAKETEVPNGDAT